VLLNKDEIEASNLIVEGFSKDSLRPAGYDLRVQTLISKRDGKSEKSEDDCDVSPQGIVLAMSQEVVKLPPGICAFASVKTTLCREGVMAINVGLIDPGWEGPISSVLLNFGKDPYRLKSGEAFLRLTFHRVTVPANFIPPPARSRATYELEVRQRFDKRLAESYMDFDTAASKGSEKYARDIRGALIKYVPLCALMLAGLTFFLNYAVLASVGKAMPFDPIQMLRAQSSADLARKEADDLRTENRDLKRQIEDLRIKVDKLAGKK